ncbi:MAG: hypothetical protein C0432_05495 [Candidatus Puniceispirillum sp.]|nr:hypothetical protein [Candidatus Pelagibacter sp.]MBA4283728.1 hypothetical protein [Candidatus Puniceispirillum sp.]
MKFITRTQHIFTFFVSLFLYGVPLTAEAVDQEKILGDLSSYIEATKQTWNVPGISVGIIMNGKVVFMKGFGVRKWGKAETVDEQTVFQIASMSKNMLAHLMAKLVEEKIIAFDDLVTKYLPQFALSSKDVTDTFTIKDLISHNSGLPGFSGDTLWTLGMDESYIIDKLKEIPLKHSFREHYGYQNQIYGLASRVAEITTGKAVEELYQKYFFKPLGMKSANTTFESVSPDGNLFSFLNSKKNPLNIAHPHDLYQGSPRVLPFSKLNYLFAGSTGVSLSVEDALKWMMMMINKGEVNNIRVLQEQSIDILRTPNVEKKVSPSHSDSQFPHQRFQKVQYGMGHFISRYGTGGKSLQIFSHMGGFHGVRSLVTICPDHKLGIVVLTNLGSTRVSFAPEVITNKFLDLYLGLNDINWNTKIKADFDFIKAENRRYKLKERLQNPSPHLSLNEYEGTYLNSFYGPCVIQKKENKLVLTIARKSVELSHFNGNQFFFEGHKISNSFCENSNGYVYFGTTNQKDINILQIYPLLHEGKQEGLFQKE